MAGVDKQCIKFVAFGTIQSVQDWSCGLWVAAQTTHDFILQPELDDAVTYALDLYQDWWTALKPRVYSHTSMVGIRAYAYPAGAVTAALVSEGELSSVQPGTSSTPHPDFTAIVASMRTPLPGRSGRGRNYLPLNGIALDTTAQVGNTDLVAVANGHAALLTGLNGLAGGSADFISSSCVVASFTRGITSVINNVIVDSKPDVQRRREDKIGAARQATSTVT